MAVELSGTHPSRGQYTITISGESVASSDRIVNEFVKSISFGYSPAYGDPELWIVAQLENALDLETVQTHSAFNEGVDDSIEKGNSCHVGSGPKGGQFCSTGGGGKAPKPAGLQVKTVKARAFKGEPVEIHNKMSKLEVGALGEKLVIAYLQANGKPGAKTLNVKINNFPIDLIQDHGAIEVKAGLISNGKSAQHWRATIGQPGKAEAKWLAQASAAKKAAFNEKKAQAILDRKQKALDDLSKSVGHKIKAYTYTMIINPDTKRADLYRFNGFHLRISWNSPQAKAGFLATVAYNE